MTIRSMRSRLEHIPGALRDVPPGEQRAGDEQGVPVYTLHDANADEFEPGQWIFEADPRTMEEGSEEVERADNFELVFEWGPQSEEAMASLGNSADDVIRQSVQVHSGVDALGHYLTFHVRGAQWGATVKASGVAWMATRVFGSLNVDAETRARLAFHAILQHELFHFATDVAIAQAEISQREAWKMPAKESLLQAGIAYSECEEKLANAWMLRAFRTALPGYRVKGKQAALVEFVRRQPPGYRDALLVGRRDWPRELQELVHEYASWADRAHSNPLLWGNGYDWACQFPMWPRIDWRDCAIHFEDDSRRFGAPAGWLTFLSRLSRIEESARFLRQLAKLDSQQQTKWDAAKLRATTALAAGRDFKLWPKGGNDVWSMRISQNFRVHLQRDRVADRWIALEIGDHKSMGHG